MTTSEHPAAHRWALANRIRTLRETSRLSQKEVAKRLEWSVSKVIRLENGTNRVDVTDLRFLLGLYGVTDLNEVEDLVYSARASRGRQWWDQYRKNVTPQTYSLLGLEASATGIDEYRTSTVPPLLRTPAYTAAFLCMTADEGTRESGMEITSLRQGITAVGGPRLRFALDESVLLRHVGSIDTMREQYRRLLEAANLTSVSIRVISLSARTAPVPLPSYALLTPPPQSFAPIVAFEHPLRGVEISDDAEVLRKQAEHFDAAWSAALNETESAKFIAAIAG